MTRQSILIGCALLATALGASAQQVITTETVRPAPAPTIEQQTTTTTVQPAPVIEHQRTTTTTTRPATEGEKDQLKAEREYREKMREAEKEYREEVRDDYDDD